MSKVLLGIFITLAAFGLLGGAYYFGTKKSSNQGIQTISPTTIPETQAPSPTEVLEPTSTKQFVNPSMVIENIKDAVSSKNHAALEGYMAPTVLVTLHASECCGALSPKKAIEQLAYTANGQAPWNFSDNNPIAVKLIAADPLNFKENIIGTASNKFAIAFHLNNNFLIDKIFMVIDHQLITP